MQRETDIAELISECAQGWKTSFAGIPGALSLAFRGIKGEISPKRGWWIHLHFWHNHSFFGRAWACARILDAMLDLLLGFREYKLWYSACMMGSAVNEPSP